MIPGQDFDVDHAIVLKGLGFSAPAVCEAMADIPDQETQISLVYSLPR